MRNDCPLPHPKYLWIDQLCIDQSSEKEKSRQVKRMAEIIEKAQYVIVWLGHDDQQSGTAMRLIADTWFIEQVPQKGPQTFLDSVFGLLCTMSFETTANDFSMITTALKPSCTDYIRIGSRSSKNLYSPKTYCLLAVLVPSR
ncbi:HET-domain-containing protein [Byssothecium circinans]|uniref:HET-domain-containing protein n=1 Tax=Byssothecium circinans TaxID=147558 RepID=A0A6A5TAR5_9PLEO|nr:HET-domain-containing protein [Byssothecium circinans]